MKKQEIAECIRHYVKGGASIGYCAQMAGMPEDEFIKYLGENQISVFHFDNEEEFENS